MAILHTKKGRPPGATNKEVDQVKVDPVRCRVCGSTERTAYTKKTEQAYAGENESGSYTHIIRRWTSCAKCGQSRIERSHENRK
jgi:hypothetical protein